MEGQIEIDDQMKKIRKKLGNKDRGDSRVSTWFCKNIGFQKTTRDSDSLGL